MRVMITGVDGYLGWPLAMRLAARGHEVGGIDNFSRRRWVEAVGGQTAIPIAPMYQRRQVFQEIFGAPLHFWDGNLCNWEFVEHMYGEFRPEAIVYLGEQPSAPFSMIDAQHAIDTQANNVLGTLATLFAMRDTCPDAHLVKLGTLGEYGIPNDCDIPEGYFPPGSKWYQDPQSAEGERAWRGDLSGLMFPRRAGSWYHLTKVHDTHNVEFACRVWRLRSTDIMQGVVYGTRTEEIDRDEQLRTRFDVDAIWGTAINRFCTQAVLDLPITPYGAGGQRRGFLPLRDSMRCLTLALENPPEHGEYRTFNQFQHVYTLEQLADRVCQVAQLTGLDAEVRHLENPRVESEQHDYRPVCRRLPELGYDLTSDLNSELVQMIEDLRRYRNRLEALREVVRPDVRWSGERRRCEYLGR